MPPGRNPIGDQPMTAAERQAKYREQQKAASKAKRPPDRRNRAQRWRDAVNELETLKEEYEDFYYTLRDMESEVAAAALRISELDLSDLKEPDISLPKSPQRIADPNDSWGFAVKRALRGACEVLPGTAINSLDNMDEFGRFELIRKAKAQHEWLTEFLDDVERMSEYWGQKDDVERIEFLKKNKMVT